MVWVYDRTQSLLVATLMHGSLTASNVFIFTPEATGAAFLIYGWLLAAVFWLLVAGVLGASRRLSGQPPPPPPRQLRDRETGEMIVR
jgi:hypothetical protein